VSEPWQPAALFSPAQDCSTPGCTKPDGNTNGSASPIRGDEGCLPGGSPVPLFTTTCEPCEVKLLPTPVAHDDGKTPEAHLTNKARRSAATDGANRTQITSLEVLARAGFRQPTPLISSSVVSPAKAPVLPANAKALGTPKLFCGMRCGASLARLDPDTSSSRTSPPFCRSGEAQDPTDAYAAGLIDGEGCISITKRALTVHVDVGMTKPGLPLLIEMAERYGGNVRPFRAATARWAEAHTWTIVGEGAVAMLRLLLPSLRIKREQAAIAIRCQELRMRMERNRFNRPGWTPELRAEGESLRIELCRLNRKGPRTDPVLPVAGAWIKAQTSLLDPFGEPFCGTWPRSGSMRSGTVFPLQPSAPRTSVTGSSVLLPTPTRHMTKDTGAPSEFERKSPEITATVLSLLPTPTRSEGETERGRRGAGSVANGGGQTLRGALSDGATISPPSTDGKRSMGLRLNPSFVGWMMGTPSCGECGREWTDPDCPHSATAFTSTSRSSSGST
jgi:hypothetical protein